MNRKNNVEERCRKILEENGGIIADKARTILLEDPALKELRPALKFISSNWRDPLTPALMSLSCKAVGGQPKDTSDAALAMSLMNLSFRIWDDIIDRVPFKLFKPTVFGKFGTSTAIIIGGLASAKAFSILNQADIKKSQVVSKTFWRVWTEMANAETINLKSRNSKEYSSRMKFRKIKTEASADMATCLKIGAIIGNGSESEIYHLGRYGLFLGIIMELWKDFHVSINLTVELAEKIKNGALPFSLLWASERSNKIREILNNLANKETIDKAIIKQIVENLIETKALDYTSKTMRVFGKKGGEELAKLKANDATQTLQLLIDAQPQLFVQSLLMQETKR